eukprot:8891769-Alexandrium_andersonii.AAC.1
MRATARAARVAQQLADRQVWTLWNMADLASTLVSRVRHLADLPECRVQCPCGTVSYTHLTLPTICSV